MIIVFQGSIDFVGFVQRAGVHWKHIATYHQVIFQQLEALSPKLQSQSAVGDFILLIKSAISMFLSGMNEIIMNCKEALSIIKLAS